MDTEEATSNATSDKMVLDTAGGPDLESQQTSCKETSEQASSEIQEPKDVVTTEPSSLISAPTLENPPPLSSLPPQAVVETGAPENQAAGEEDHPRGEDEDDDHPQEHDLQAPGIFTHGANQRDGPPRRNPWLKRSGRSVPQAGPRAGRPQTWSRR